MKLCKKISIFSMMAVLFIATFSSPVAARESSPQQETNGLTTDQREFGEAVMDHLDNFTDSEGNVQIKIINKDQLKTKLDNVEIPFTVEELNTTVNQFNNYMASGENVITDMSKDVSKQLEDHMSNPGEISTYALTCGDVLTAIGFIHAGSYSAAAYLLGVTGPAALIVPLLVSAAYGAASIAC